MGTVNGRKVEIGLLGISTNILRCKGLVDTKQEVKFSDETVGILCGTDKSYIPTKEGQLTVEADLSFEQLPILLNAGIDAVVAVPDTGTGQIFTYDFPTTVAKTPTQPSFVAGDEDGAESILAAVNTQFKISGKQKDILKYSGDFTGKNPVPGSFSSLPLEDTEEVYFGNSSITIDNVDDEFGDTVLPASLLSYDLTCKTGWTPRWTAGSGQQYDHAAFTPKQYDVELKGVLEVSSAVLAERALWKLQTPRKIQITVTGSDLETAGVYDTKLFITNLAGKFTRFDKLTEEDGISTIGFTFKGKYNATAAEIGSLVVVNSAPEGN